MLTILREMSWWDFICVLRAQLICPTKSEVAEMATKMQVVMNIKARETLHFIPKLEKQVNRALRFIVFYLHTSILLIYLICQSAFVDLVIMTFLLISPSFQERLWKLERSIYYSIIYWLYSSSVVKQQLANGIVALTSSN